MHTAMCSVRGGWASEGGVLHGCAEQQRLNVATVAHRGVVRLSHQLRRVAGLRDVRRET